MRTRHHSQVGRTHLKAHIGTRRLVNLGKSNIRAKRRTLPLMALRTSNPMVPHQRRNTHCIHQRLAPAKSHRAAVTWSGRQPAINNHRQTFSSRLVGQRSHRQLHNRLLHSNRGQCSILPQSPLRRGRLGHQQPLHSSPIICLLGMILVVQRTMPQMLQLYNSSSSISNIKCRGGINHPFLEDLNRCHHLLKHTRDTLPLLAQARPEILETCRAVALRLSDTMLVARRNPHLVPATKPTLERRR